MLMTIISYAIVLHSVVPVRAEADEGAEQLTQLLFGETVEILNQEARWYYIHNDYDGQEGWVDFKMVTPMTEEEYKTYTSSDLTNMVCMPMAFCVSEANQQTIPLTAGTHLANYKDGHFEVLGAKFLIDPSMVSAPKELNEANFMQTMRFFLNIPYLWGGKNAMGLDCSGFSGILLSLFGKKLLRNAREQVTQGTPISDISQAKAGDLAFFNHKRREGNPTLNIIHVGVMIDPEHIVHCSGRVKIEKIDSIGIINTETGQYSHDLVQINRY